MVDVRVPSTSCPAPGRDGAERVSDASGIARSPQLRGNVIEGRLTLDEFSERVGRALEAQILGDLEAVLTDLPPLNLLTCSAARPGHAARPPPPPRRRAASAALACRRARRAQPKGRWRISGKTNAVAFMGGCDMDLRSAEIDGGLRSPSPPLPSWAESTSPFPRDSTSSSRASRSWGARPEGARRPSGARLDGDNRARLRRHGWHRRQEQAQPDQAPAGQGDRGRASPRAAPPPATVLTPPSPALTPPPLPTTPPSGTTQSPADLATAVPDVATDGTVTILFCDMVDYAGMTERLGRSRLPAVVARATPPGS